MSNMDKSLKLCSYNCQGYKGSIVDVKYLCQNHDVILIQEHWLMPHDLSLLQNTHDDYYAFGLSAMDTSVDIISGRPYGGTAILCHKKLATKVKVLESHDSRIT